MVLLGHWRLSSLRGGNFLYFCEGSLSLESRLSAIVLLQPEAQRFTHIGMLTDGRVTFLVFS